MSAFLILDPRPVYFTTTGEVCAGGSLKFFQAGTTTPQDVYGDQGLTVNNGAVLTLGTDGRTSVDVWGDGSLSYRVQLFDANSTLQFDVDNVGLPGGTGNQIPSLVSGQFLTNDGSQTLWAPILQLPDPTGQADKVLSTDGTNFTWVTKPTDGTAGAAGTNANVTVTSSSVKWNNGSGNLAFIQTGTASAPATGTPATSIAITFPVAFASTPWFVKASVTADGFATENELVAIAETSQSATGFTALLDTNDSGASINSNISVKWFAIGAVAS